MSDHYSELRKSYAPFENSVIKEPVNGKPHIVSIDGWWRVSQVSNCKGMLDYHPYNQAHKFAGKLNAKRSALC